MSCVNAVGAALADRSLVRAATDVTGFGLLGHLASICRASGVTAEINARDVPAIDREVFGLIADECVPGGTRQNLETANTVTDWGKTPSELKLLLADAQTSGGLLLAIAPRKLAAVIRLLTNHKASARAIIGRILPRGKRLIIVKAR
jgi:selenide,water dikinase